MGFCLSLVVQQLFGLLSKPRSVWASPLSVDVADCREDLRPCALSVCIRPLHLGPASSAMGVCQGGLLREGLAATSLPLHGACCPFPLCRPTFTLVSLSGTVDFNSLTNQLNFKVTQLHHCFKHFGPHFGERQ